MNSKSKLVLFLLLSVGTPIQANTGQEMSGGAAMATSIALYARQMGTNVCGDLGPAFLTCESAAVGVFASATIVASILDASDRFQRATRQLALMMDKEGDVDMMAETLEDMLKEVAHLGKLVSEKSIDYVKMEFGAKRMLEQGQNFLTQVNTVMNEAEAINDWGGNPFYHLYCAFSNCPSVPPEAEVALNALKNNMKTTLPYIETVHDCSKRVAEGKELCARSFMMDTVKTIKEKLLRMKGTLGQFVDDMKKANPTTLFGEQYDCNQLEMESKNLSSRLDARLASCNHWAGIYFWLAAVALAAMLFLQTKPSEALHSQQAPALPTTQNPDFGNRVPPPALANRDAAHYQPLSDNESGTIPMASLEAACKFFLAIVLLVCCSLWRTKVTQAAFLEVELDTINKIPYFAASGGCQSDEHLKRLMQAVMTQADISLQ